MAASDLDEWRLAAACHDTVASERFDTPLLLTDQPDGRRWLDSVLAHAVHSSRASIMVTDADLDPPGPRIVYVNPAFEVMTGYRAADVLGRDPRLLQGPATERAVLDRLRTQLAAGHTFEGEAVNYRADGTPFIMSWRIAPVFDDVGRTTHFVAIQDDVTTDRVESLDARILITDLHRLVQPRREGVVGDLEVAAASRPAVDRLPVGGDWHDVVGLGDGSTAVVVGDVAGSGAGTVVMMSVLRWSLRALLLGGVGVDRAVAEMHRIAATEQVHASVAVAVVAPDGATGVVTAGHPPVLVLRAGGSDETVRTDNPTLGFPVEWPAEPAVAIALAPGDAVVLYTDGLIDGGRIDVDAIAPELRTRLRRAGVDVSHEPDAACRALLAGAAAGDDAAVVVARRR